MTLEATATAPTTDAPTTTTQDQQSAPTPTPPPAPAQTIEVDGKPVDVAKLLEDNARFQREAESARVNAKAKVAEDAKKDQLLSVAKLAGIEIKDPDAETVDTLTQKLAGQAASGGQNDEATNTARRQAALVTAAWKAGAPADKATYLGFLASQDQALQALDPNAADYQNSVDARIKAIVDADPIFKATPGGTSRSGSETFAGAGGTEAVTQESFDKMTIQEQTNLFRQNPDLFRRLAGTV
jgi:hypothetical protein